MRKVTVIDYGIGNILSVKRAFESFGAEVLLTESTKDVLEAQYLVLPGVGAFADGIKGLNERGLVEAIREYSKKGLPFLGICLGMQMMLDESEEFGTHKGLGLIPGKVIAIEQTDKSGLPHKIPHIGWNELRLPEGRRISYWDASILSGIEEGEPVYFVHSYTAHPEDSRYRFADIYYGGRLISAVIRKGNLYGCQFHPEKSGKIGLKIIENFLNLGTKVDSKMGKL